MHDNTLYILSFVIVTGVIILLLIEYVFKKWSCTEGQCEKTLGGDYSTLQECKTACDKSKDSEDISTDSEDISTNFSCTSIGCVNDPNGPYNNSIDCANNCYTNYTYGYPYYYGRPIRRLWNPIRRRLSPRRSPIRRSPRRSPIRRSPRRSPIRRSPGGRR